MRGSIDVSALVSPRTVAIRDVVSVYLLIGGEEHTPALRLSVTPRHSRGRLEPTPLLLGLRSLQS
jgi:hypothetical protein